jgi:hypothetical protein
VASWREGEAVALALAHGEEEAVVLACGEEEAVALVHREEEAVKTFRFRSAREPTPKVCDAG